MILGRGGETPRETSRLETGSQVSKYVRLRVGRVFFVVKFWDLLQILLQNNMRGEQVDVMGLARDGWCVDMDSGVHGVSLYYSEFV